jgi:hypothetical protein
LRRHSCRPGADRAHSTCDRKGATGENRPVKYETDPTQGRTTDRSTARSVPYAPPYEPSTRTLNQRLPRKPVHARDEDFGLAMSVQAGEYRPGDSSQSGFAEANPSEHTSIGTSGRPPSVARNVVRYPRLSRPKACGPFRNRELSDRQSG